MEDGRWGGREGGWKRGRAEEVRQGRKEEARQGGREGGRKRREAEEGRVGPSLFY